MSEASDKAAAARAARAKEAPAEGTDEKEKATEEESVVQDMPGVTQELQSEEHTVEDMIRASYALFGVSSEVMAGAVAEAGWEMTKQTRIDDARVILEKFLELPV